MLRPRLTRALRAFAGVSPRLSDKLDNGDDLAAKHKHQYERKLKHNVSWSHLAMLIHSGISTEEKACSAKLQELLNTAREIGGFAALLVHKNLFYFLLYPF